MTFTGNNDIENEIDFLEISKFPAKNCQKWLSAEFYSSDYTKYTV